MTADDYKTLATIAALAISLISIWLTRRNWLEGNRPIVCAFVEEDSIGAGIALFNFCISNTGSRPAVRISIRIKPSELEKLIDPNASQHERKLLHDCFKEETTIPIIRNGETLKAGLGSASESGAGKPQLQYGASAEVKIYYRDLEGRKYVATHPITIFPRDGFNGVGTWEKAV
ncbi:hypothetical protein [Extensimonas sp. H3M7-6]|uniref:hypothetical protein n=1 Tax=Extensimonas soli TaxID=3031322 RepID=UPI0023DB9032|nr:hypothetical protein [Extensimonas sp. H3M7-6]MDF1482274.1 hypothetical protein [Extensimonas sp. H3M7-6]